MKILVYGTLRREGIYHFDYLRKYKAKFIKEVKIKGYDLFNLTSYPAIVRGEGEVLVEMFEVSDECFEKIDKMEKNVGYESEETEGGTIWLFSEEELNRYKRKKIEHGDYIKFLHEERLKFLIEMEKQIGIQIIKEEKIIKSK